MRLRIEIPDEQLQAIATFQNWTGLSNDEVASRLPETVADTVRNMAFNGGKLLAAKTADATMKDEIRQAITSALE